MAAFITHALVRLGLVAAVAAALAVGPLQTAAAQIKLGFVGGLSGSCAPLVDSQLKGLELALADFNRAGGVNGTPVELVVRDGKTEPDESATAARDLIVNEEVDLLTGPCSSAVLLAVSAVVKEEKVPIYATIAGTTRISIEFGHEYLYLIGDNAYNEPRAIAEFVAKQPWNRVATVALDFEWGQQLVKVFEEYLKELKPEAVITRKLWPGFNESNFSSIIVPALSDNPDVILSVTFGDSTTNLINQGRGYGLLERSKLLIFMPLDSLKTMGKDMPEGIYGFQRAPFYALPGEGVKAFVSAYQSAHGEYPDDWAVLGYDGFRQVFAAAARAGSVEHAALREALTGHPYDGLRGTMVVRAIDGTNNSPVFIGQTAHTDAYDFPVLENVVSISGLSLMPDPELIKRRREAAKN